MQGGAGMGRVRSKKSKPIPTPPHGARLKSPPRPCPTTFTGREKPVWDEVGEGGSSGAAQNCHPYFGVMIITLCR